MSESCSGNCETCASHSKEDPSCAVRLALKSVKHKYVVISGKGGVGKSTVAVNLALSLALQGRKVGLLDVDVHGPSVPKMLHLEGQQLLTDESGTKIVPVAAKGLKVVSVGFMLDASDTPVVWRGPVKISVIQQFLGQTEWGELDDLVIDCPPGTGDEPLSVFQLIPDADGAVIVTTPQQVAALDVSKSISFCNQLGVAVLGLVENMAGFVCPGCGKLTPVFGEGGGEALAAKYGVPLLGRIPLDPMVCVNGDAGTPFVRADEKSPTTKAFEEIVEKLLVD